MNQMPNLIEYLLLTHDYVVIPRMGTFIAQQISACRNDEEEVFLPPYRSLRFNTELNHDDDLLIDSIINLYKVSRTEAELMMGLWISELRQSIEDEEFVDFGSLGSFSRKADGTLVFTSLESGIASPENYGLDALHFSEVQPERKAKIVPMTAIMETNDKEITIHINRRIANIFVAACAAILLFIVFNNPVPTVGNIQERSSIKELLMGNLESAYAIDEPRTVAPQNTQRKTVVLLHHYVIPQVNEPVTSESIAASETTIAKQPEIAAAPGPKVQLKETDVQKVITNVEESVAQQTQYCIVMASAISKKNAESYVLQLKKQGFNNPRVYITKKMVRVVVGNYDNSQDAYNVAEAMRRNSEEYGSVWVLKL